LQKKETDLVQLVKLAKESLSATYTGKPHLICIENEQIPVMLEVDALYITNVLRNLIENALKYSDDGVEIRIRIRQDKIHTCLEVEDNGWGIERKYHRKIFEQYFQVPNDKEVRRRGYGIGLAFTYYIMEAHGGSIRVKSELGKGSTFTCVFPMK
jgi:K+-sensing histidine kinase KdpD